MKKLDGTITLSILDEDNSQRVIFRIIPLCTKDGMVFKNRIVSYPDYGSLRIIPDKREQSSFKDRMREIGHLCCVQLISDGKELTKIRQNRNYDPNQGEYNQFAIYSDVICGFEPDAIFEVFQENQEYSHALTEKVLIQRGKVLYGPVETMHAAQIELLKPFGNEEYLMHTVEDTQGNERTYYWNPDAIVTWRQRKKNLRLKTAQKEYKPTTQNDEIEKPITSNEIPIGAKLEILNEDKTNEEHISELNIPVSESANRLEQNIKPNVQHTSQEAPTFHGTPIAQAPKGNQHNQQKNHAVHSVVEKQISQKHSTDESNSVNRRPVENPINNLRVALREVWSIPALRQECINLFAENKEIQKVLTESQLFHGQTSAAYSAAKADLDAIEGERISLLIELDKVKENYQQLKNKMYLELAKQKKDEIDSLDKRLIDLNALKQTLEETLAQIGQDIQRRTLDIIGQKSTMDITSNGSDLVISPSIGTDIHRNSIVEIIRNTLNSAGFECKQDCITEFMILLSLHSELCVLTTSLHHAEIYIKNLLHALGLLSVSAWPSVFGTLRIVSLLPENELRTPTVEVIRNTRAPIQAYGHKTIRLIDYTHIHEAGLVPVFHAPLYNLDYSQELLCEDRKPISLQSILEFSRKRDPLYKDSEEYLNGLEEKLKAYIPQIEGNILQSMRVFIRTAAPQLTGGFMEATDAAVLAWIVPVLMQSKYSLEDVAAVIGDLPRSMQAVQKVKS